VAKLGERELLPLAVVGVRDVAGRRLRFGQLPQGGDVADEVDPEANGVAG
jgi:hypothetical protein